MSAQNQASLIAEATAQQELRALSNQCLLCLLWHHWDHTAGLYGVCDDGLYMNAAESLAMAATTNNRNMQLTKLYFVRFHGQV